MPLTYFDSKWFEQEIDPKLGVITLSRERYSLHSPNTE